MDAIRVEAGAAAASIIPEYLVWESATANVRITVHPQAAERMRREAARAGSSRDLQAGGLLLGSVERDGAVVLEDIEPVEWPRGPDKPRGLETALARHAAAAASHRVVGFYRTHALNELFLNAGDLVLVKRYFPDPANVFILLKPGPEGRLATRYFFRQDGLMRSEGSEPGFPFGRPAAGIAPPPPMEMMAAAGMDEPTPAMPRAAKAALYTLAIAVTAGASLYFARAPQWPAWPVAATRAPAAAPAPQLSLEVEKRGRDVLLKWDRRSEAVRRARQAVLDVEDGAASKRYDVDLEQLRTGSIYYTPIGADVQLKLEVYWGADRPLVESVRLLSAAAPLAEPAAAPAPLPAVLREPPPAPEPGPARRVTRQYTPARPPAPPLRFNPQPRQRPGVALDGPAVAEQERARGRAAMAAAEGIPGLKPSVTITVPRR